MAAIVTFASPFIRRARFLALGAALLGCCVARPAAAGTDSHSDELSSLQRAALRQAHLDERSRQSLLTRLRLSALLPHLRLNVGRGWQWDSSSSSTSTSSTPDVNDHLSYGLAAQWDLSRLLFQREEILLQRDAQRLASWRAQLLLRVARLYAQRCKAVTERATADSDATRQRLGERVAALDISLAALTGDEHVGRKLHRCPTTATASATLSRELEALSDDAPLEPPTENLAEEQALTSDPVDPS